MTRRVVTLLDTGEHWEIRLSWRLHGWHRFYAYESAITAALYLADSDGAELWT